MAIFHMQIGLIHIFIHECQEGDAFEHKIVIKGSNYKHTILHGEPNLMDAKIHAIDVANRLGMITLTEATEAIASLKH